MKYLGETILEQKDTEFKDYSAPDWAMYFLESYGGVDGDHHKAWVLDQIARCLKGTPVIIKLAKWDNGHEEYRVITGEPSESYLQWVVEMKGAFDEEEEEYEWGYEEGIAP